MTPTVSVLMTCYNREHLIGEAIQSVLDSDFTDFELIISDDASTDQTVEVARRFAEKDARIKIFVNGSNLGDYGNRNAAAAHAKGTYIKYLDSDDQFYPGGLRRMVEAMLAHPEAALGIAQLNKQKLKLGALPVCLTSAEAYREHFYGKEIFSFGPSGSIIKRSVFFQAGCFSHTRYVSDTEFWLKLAALYPVVKLSDDLVMWRVHEGQEYQLGHQTHFYLRKVFPIFRQALYAPNCPLPADEVAAIMHRLRWKHARDLLSLGFRSKQPLIAWNIFRETGLSWMQLLKGFQKFKPVV